MDCDVVCRAVLERGEASTFGFGRGVAIPHAAIPGLDRPIGAFARLKPAQDFGATDNIPADAHASRGLLRQHAPQRVLPARGQGDLLWALASAIELWVCTDGPTPALAS